MPDDISIPHSSSLHSGPGLARASFTHSYRARRTGMDPGTKRLFLAAAALGLVLVAGMSVWSFTGHRAAGIPVIDADGRPLRVKPDNPGGMTVIGANDQIMGGSGSQASDLAPPPEQPAPQALQAQKQAMAPAAPAAPTPAAPTPLPAGPSAAPGANVASVPETPAPAARSASPASAAQPAAPARPAAAGMLVQIAAVDSEQGATAEWQRLAKKLPDLLADRRPVVQRAEHDGKTVWRLRTGGFADMAEATRFCTRVRAKGVGCSIANF